MPAERNQPGAGQAEPLLSILVPVHNDAGSLDSMMEVLDGAVEKYRDSCEIIVVDDGSLDGSADKLEELAKNYPSLVVLALTKNFGQHGALSAGLDYARGKWVLITDSDEAIRADQLDLLFRSATEGVKIVNGKLLSRNQSRWRKFTSATAQVLLKWNFKSNIPTYLYTILLLEREVVDVVRKMPERRRIIHAQIAWTGYPTVTVELERADRIKRRSHYRYAQLLRLFLECITAFTLDPLFLPLQAAKWVGILAVLVLALFLIPGLEMSELFLIKTSILVTMVLSAVILGFLGFLGAYIARITSQTRMRPLYLVRKIIGQNAPAGPQP